MGGAGSGVDRPSPGSRDHVARGGKPVRFRTAVVGLTLIPSLLCAQGAPAATAAAGPGAGRLACGTPVLSHPVHTASAVTALGAALPEVAAGNGTTARDLAAELRSDPTLWLDRCGAGYYVDPEPARTATDAGADAGSGAGSGAGADAGAGEPAAPF